MYTLYCRYVVMLWRFLEHDLLSQSQSLMDPVRGRRYARQMVDDGAAKLLSDQAARLGLKDDELQGMINTGRCRHLEILKDGGDNELVLLCSCLSHGSDWLLALHHPQVHLPTFCQRRG